MDYKYLASLLFKEDLKTTEEYEKIYPQRNLKEGAQVTRIAPSPTGFMHLGNLFGAITDERIAHLSDGIFYLRIEDTDKKREVEGGVETILKVFDRFGLKFDEGAGLNGDNGNYGPYRQRQRELIYKAYAKSLVEKGLAYPCFCTEEELEKMLLPEWDISQTFLVSHQLLHRVHFHHSDKQEAVESAMDALRKKFGRSVISYGTAEDTISGEKIERD